MPRKPKFRPQITKVKLTPDQAVLQCQCYNIGAAFDSTQTGRPAMTICGRPGYKGTTYDNRWRPGTASS